MYYLNECPICYNLLTQSNKIISQCDHYFCKDCYSKINVCALCRTILNKPKSITQIIYSALYFLLNIIMSLLIFIKELLVSLSMIITLKMNGYDDDFLWWMKNKNKIKFKLLKIKQNITKNKIKPNNN